jgi:hypothetical protein
VILTPHSAGLSKEAAIRMAISTAKDVLAGIDGKLDPAMVVNREVLRDQGLSGRCLTRAGSSACQPAVSQGSPDGRLARAGLDVPPEPAKG